MGNWLRENDKVVFIAFLPSVIYFVIGDSLLTNLITGVDTGSVIAQNLLRLIFAIFLLVAYVGSGSSILKRKNRSQAWLLLSPSALFFAIAVLGLGDKSRDESGAKVAVRPYKYSTAKLVIGFGLFFVVIIVIALVYGWAVE